MSKGKLDYVPGKNIRDWAVAAQVYAKQAKDLTLIKHATDIRLRAERRAGELLKQMGTKKARHSGRGHTTRVGSRAVTFASPFATDLESKGRKKQESGPASPKARLITASRSR